MQSIIDSLGFDVRFFALQIVLFLVLWVFMANVYWKPMLAHLAARDKGIADAYHTVEQTRHEMETMKTDYQTRIGHIEADARTRIQTAIKEAQTERERLVKEAQSAAEHSIKTGLAEMEAEKTQALRDLQERVVTMASEAAGKALSSHADSASIRRVAADRVAASAPRN